jgi:hypothetical protein
MTLHTLVPPESKLIPELVPHGRIKLVFVLELTSPVPIPEEGENDIVAVVDVFFFEDEKLMVKSFIQDKPGNVPVLVESIITTGIAFKSFDVPAATSRRPCRANSERPNCEI